MPNMILQSNGSPEQTDARRRLALAISAKGVPTDAKASFIQMAENVAQIPQQYSDGESYFASFVMPEEYMFNVFGICEKMIGENPHPEFPAFFVAEYYRGYDSLVLTGADAYLTCDGDFYQTLDKTAEVTHVWHDEDNGKSNRYVVFYYMQDGYTFANSTVELCPRRVALAGRCASFIVTGENRLTDVYVLGTLENFDGGTTGDSWNPAQVIRNYPTHSSGSIYNNATLVRSILLPETKSINGGGIFGYANATTDVKTSITDLILNGVEQIGENASLFLVGSHSSNTFHYLDGLRSVEMRDLQVLKNNLFYIGNFSYSGYFSILKDLQSIKLPSLVTLEKELIKLGSNPGGNYDGGDKIIGSLSEVMLNNLETISNQYGLFYFVGSSNSARLHYVPLKTLYLPNLKNVMDVLYHAPITASGTESGLGLPMFDLIDIEVGSMETNLNIKYWNPKYVIADPTKLAQLNANIRDHIAAKVSDRTGDTALTFTVSANLYANLEQATIDAFTAKNWNVAGA